MYVACAATAAQSVETDELETIVSEIPRRAAQAQLDAYNAHDIDAFVACYAEDVVVYDLPSGEETGRGTAWMREVYGDLFERTPERHAAVTSRTVVGNFVFDHELVTGLGRPEPLIAMAIYQVGDDGLIAKVWFVK